jgi:hypothetical protein
MARVPDARLRFGRRGGLTFTTGTTDEKVRVCLAGSCDRKRLGETPCLPLLPAGRTVCPDSVLFQPQRRSLKRRLEMLRWRGRLAPLKPCR